MNPKPLLPSILLPLAVLFGLLLPATALEPTAERPNILFIFLDDFGWKDTSYMGSDFYETPHLDALAKGGMIFTDAYSAAANCAPARASLLSGQYSPRHKIYNVGTNPRGKAAHRKLAHIPGVATLDPATRTWAHQIRDAGYTTATMGKWHLSKDPLPYGFDLNVAGGTSGGPPRGYFPPHPGVPGIGEVPDREYITDTLSNRACDWITENKERAWCLYLTHFAVHTPIQAKKEDIEYFQTKKPGTLHNHAVMAAMIKAVDDGVGQLTETLKKQGLHDKTAIVFFSDNGGYGPATSMAPLKGYKGTYYEGGIREPFFVNWPGTVAPGTTCATPIIGVDLYPTLCDIADADLPADQIGDGVSIRPLLEDGDEGDLDRDAIFWHFPAYLQSYQRFNEQRDPLFRSRPCSIIRIGDWKLHEYHEDVGFDGLELYNLRDDIGETTNLAATNPEKRDELHARLNAWLAETEAPVPGPNPAYDATVEAEAIRLKSQAKAPNAEAKKKSVGKAKGGKGQGAGKGKRKPKAAAGKER